MPSNDVSTSNGSDAEYPSYSNNWDDYFYSDLYYASRTVTKIGNNLFDYGNYFNLFLSLTYVVVFIFDLTRKKPKIKSSFFIISFVNVCISIYYRGKYILDVTDLGYEQWYYSMQWLNIPMYTGFLLDGVIVPIIALNRYTAIKYPTKHSFIWTNKNTVILLSTVVSILAIYSTLKIYIFYGSYDLPYVEQYLDLFCTLAGFVLTVAAVATSKKAHLHAQSAQMKAEKKLLFLSAYLVCCHLYLDVSQIAKNLIDPTAWYGAGELFNAFYIFFYQFSNFAMYCGMIVALHVNSSKVREAYRQCPPFSLIAEIVTRMRPKQKTVPAPSSDTAK